MSFIAPYTVTDTTTEAISNAESNGFEVIKTTSKTILLDIDNEESLRNYEELLPIAAPLFNLRETDRWKSKSGNTHILLTSTMYLNPWQRLILQACLGSDRKRELLGLNLLDNGANTFSFLFKPKEAVKNESL